MHRPFFDDHPPAPGGSDAGPSILALDNVELDLPLAGLGTRSLALMIDGLVLGLAAVVWGIFIATLSSFSELSGGWLIGIGAFGYFLLQWGYFSAFEILLDGKTPGKIALSLQTVSHVGGKPSVGALLIRNLLRPIDYVFGIFFMALDPRSRRLGDMVASTLVAHRGLDGPERRRLRTGRRPESWGPSEIILVDAFVARAERLEPEVAHRLASQLVGWMKRTEPAFVDAASRDAPSTALVNDLHHLWHMLAVREVAEHEVAVHEVAEHEMSDGEPEDESADPGSGPPRDEGQGEVP